MTVLNVKKIAFHGQTGDNRSPEDFAFPAAMTSMMEYLGEDVGTEQMEAHGVMWTHRSGNDGFVAASGIGFALLWDEKLCAGAMDLLQAVPYDRGIDNAFAWAGWKYERVTGSGMRQAAVRAVSQGRPFIALGLTSVPEAALVCGVSDDGGTLYGWGHFQNGMETIENGMFAASGWEDRTWELIIPTEKAERTLDVCGVIREGVRIMRQTEAEGYRASDAAYEAWIAALEKGAGQDKALNEYHHAVLFNMAEARCWCGEFLKAHGIEAGKHFKAVHDLCWKADAAPDHEALIAVMREIQAEERAALRELEKCIGF